jgi:hypothetical protein
MVPKVAGKGSSFKGAALYYLHDKGALTSERVAFSQTQNLPTRDAEKAIKCMAWTVIHQSEIKARAGGSAKGRKLANPVYTYSLSWAPDESPTPEEMIEAARESVRALGLEGHEMLFVSHNDEPHPHIHVIVNRVHPETGIAAPLSNDHLKLSAWAEEYEKRQGKIRCEQRVENNALRRKKHFVRDQFSQRSGDFHRWRRLRLQDAFARQQKDKENLSAAHKLQRDFLFANKERNIRKADRDIRAEHRGRWHIIYADQKDAREKLKLEQKTVFSRMKAFFKDAKQYFHAPREQRQGFLRGLFSSVVGGPQKLTELESKQKLDRARIAKKIDERRKDEFRKINTNYKAELAKLAEQQRRQNDEFAKKQSEESQRRAKQIKEEADLQTYRQELAKQKEQERQEKLKSLGKAAQQFDKARDAPSHEALRQKLRDAMTGKRYREIEEQKEDITKPKARPTQDFNKVRGTAHGNEAQKEAEKGERIRKQYRAFRDMADEVTKGRKGPGGGRSIEKKPPKGPEFR